MKSYALVDNYPLWKLNSLRVKATGRVAFIFSEDGLLELLDDYNPSEYQYKVLGNGSNVLFTKTQYEESLIFIATKLLDGITVNIDGLYVEAGCSLHSLAWFAYEKKINGYSFLEDIPGSLGGAIMMNAGTYSDTISQLVISIRYYNYDKRVIENYKCNEASFGKRTCAIGKNGNIVLGALLKREYSTACDWELDEFEKMFEIKRKRYLKQPRTFPSAGSVFVRPDPIDGKQYYVWQLLEMCNLKGARIGDAMISEKHPGFIINVGDAKPSDYLELIELCQSRVYQMFNIELKLEWKKI